MRVGKGEEEECVPQDTIAAKYEAYSKPNSPSHEGAHSSQEEFSHRLISCCESQARGETINIKTYFTGCGGNEGNTSSDCNSSLGKVVGADALTFLPDRWLTTMSHRRRGHSVLFDPSSVTRNVGLSCARPRG